MVTVGTLPGAAAVSAFDCAPAAPHAASRAANAPEKTLALIMTLQRGPDPDDKNDEKSQLTITDDIEIWHLRGRPPKLAKPG
jgi:hypothetical protein